MNLRLLSVVLPVISLASMLGCASSAPPRIIRVTDVGAEGTPLLPGQPLIVEFHENDRIPLSFVVAGPLLVTEGDTPLTLRATRRFFLRLDEDGLTSSLDGKNFADNSAPGSFAVGLSATREAGVRANVTIKGPTPKEPVAN